jgi:hypothetical protein
MKEAKLIYRLEQNEALADCKVADIRTADTVSHV